MVKIQQDSVGSYHVTIPKEIARAKNWQKGNEIGFCIVDNEINKPLPGDVYLRKNR